MKTIFLKLSLVAIMGILISCKNEVKNPCCDELEETKKINEDLLKTNKELEDKYLQVQEQINYRTKSINNASKTQVIEDIPANRQANYSRYRLRKDLSENNFKTDLNEINIAIPITNENLRIVDYFHISTESTNAMVIILDGNQGGRTDPNNPRWLLKETLNIDKIGLDKNNLLRDGKIKVFILHENDPSDIIIKICSYRECVKNSGYSKEGLCNAFVPLEDEGSIINGGRR